MTPEKRVEILEGAREAFFQAMLNGHAGGQNRRSLITKSNNCSTTTIFLWGDYTVKDERYTHPESDRSFGSTLITHRDIPVWAMSYGGWYKEEAISFLKEALAENYDRRAFDGGRGPYKVECFYGSKIPPFHLTYSNQWEGNFWSFRGDEHIYRREEPDVEGSIMLGHHHFFGGTII